MTTPAPSGGPSPLRVGGLALLALGAVAGIIGLASIATGDGGGGTSAAPPGGDPSATAPELPGEGFTPTDGATPGPGDPGADGTVPGTPGGEGAVPGAPGAGPGGEGGVPVPSFGPDAGPGGAGGGTGAGGGDGTGAGGAGGAGAGGAGGTGGTGGAGTGGAGTAGTDGGTGTAAGAGTGGAAAGAEVRMPLRVYNNSTIPGLAARGKADFEAAGWTVTDTGGYNGRIPVSTVYYRPGTAEQDAAESLASTFGLRAEARFAGIQDASPGIIVILTRDYQGEDKNG